MRALRFDRFGDPSVLRVEEVSSPKFDQGEVLVRVAAAAINPSDAKNVAGAFKAVTTLPRTPGRDFAGIVVGGGQSVGEEVWGSAPGLGMTRDGTHAEYVVVPTGALARKPAALTMAQAASLGVAYLTAWAALVEAARLQAGETVLILGAGGAVGRAATQIANWKGARVIAGVLGTEPLPGVAAVVDTRSDQMAAGVREKTDGLGACAVLDAVGGVLCEAGLESLRPGGRQVAITSTGDGRVSFDLVRFYRNRLRLIGVNSNDFTAAEIGTMAGRISEGFDAGALVAPPCESVTLEAAEQAYRKVLGGHAVKKQVIAFGF